MNPVCPRCGAKGSHRYGSYWRYEDAQRISRYRWLTVRQVPFERHSHPHLPAETPPAEPSDQSRGAAQARRLAGLAGAVQRGTFEHTRLKPLAVAVMVAWPERCILGVGVAPIPASGLIAERSRERYGHRLNQSGPMRRGVLRDNIKRLTRRTWCTTKRPARLEDVLATYAHWHNTRLIPPPADG